MTPFGNPFLPLDMVGSFWKTALDSQQRFFEASGKAFESASRAHESPDHAAERATIASRSGEPSSWYRTPAATWTEVATDFWSVNPVFQAWMQPWTAFQGLTAMSPTAFGSHAMPFGANPLMGAWMSLLAGPTAQMLSAYTQANMCAPANAGHGLFGAEGSTPREAIASITLPDNTTYRISIPIADPMPFWPFAAGFGESSVAGPLTVDIEPATSFETDDGTTKH